MKIKKYLNTKTFSKILAFGVLLNSMPISSLAGILSEDGRYETFEGSDITINDILEEDKVDVEIEGNTMVNVANQKDAVPITKSYTVEGTNHIPLQGEYDGKARPVIEGNTMYYNNDTGELLDTFIEGANLSLVSSFEDQVVTQEMVDAGLEDAENLGKYKVEYKVTGKNKFNTDISIRPDMNDRVDSYSNNEVVMHTYINSQYVYIPVLKYKCKANTNYTLSYKVEKLKNSSTANIKVFAPTYHNVGTDGFEIGIGKDGEDSVITFNTGEYETFYILTYTVSSEATGYEENHVRFYDIQLEENSTATKYEPYKESIKTFYLNSPLLEGDTIEDIDGKATHVKRYKKIVLNGINEGNWIDSGFDTDNTRLFRLKIEDMIKDSPRINNVFSDRFKTSIRDIYEGDYECIIPNEGLYNNINIRISKSKLLTQDVEGFKEWLNQNPVTVYYKLNTPVYETISKELILIDSYVNGHLDLNTSIPVNKVDFIPTTANLNYLYPSTEYTIQFESDNKGKIDTVLLGDEVLYDNYSVSKGINRFNITTPSEISSTELILDGIGFNLSNLVVAQSSDKNFDYFEGMKSVGQDDKNGHNIEIVSNNKNLFDINKYPFQQGMTYHYVYGYKMLGRVNAVTADMIPIKPSTQYKYHCFIEDKSILNEVSIFYFDSNKEYIGRFVEARDDSHYITTPSNAKYISITIMSNNNTYLNGDKLFLTYGTGLYNDNYISSQSNKIKISLSEPLRSLPNGTKDRIIKKNGQWVIERNCKEIILNGSENWNAYYGQETETRKAFYYNLSPRLSYDYYGKGKAISNFNFYGASIGVGNSRADEGFTLGGSYDFVVYVYKSRMSTYDKEGFKEWLSENPINIVYQLEKPTYEPLKIKPILNTYTDVTYISNDSVIPANLKVTVDRTINRATEAIELAKTNPTIANLSRARYWTNLLKESTKKDELQEEINNNVDIVDLQLERKTTSANLDLYIKCENMLSMSLDTNQISFNDFSGIEDVEKTNAVNVSINSSLPYQLNAYLPSEIKNADKTKTLDKSILNIKESSDSTYQAFTNINDKIVLKDNCSSGNQLTHSIDIMLKGGIAHEKDVYKAVIRLEAEQK